MLHSETCLKSDKDDAPVVFGIKEITVAFVCLGIEEVRKKLLTAAVKSLPTRSQDEMKNSEENPSGPGALHLGKDKTISLISYAEGIATRISVLEESWRYGCIARI